MKHVSKCSYSGRTPISRTKLRFQACKKHVHRTVMYLHAYQERHKIYLGHTWGSSIHSSTQVMWGYLLASVKPGFHLWSHPSLGSTNSHWDSQRIGFLSLLKGQEGISLKRGRGHINEQVSSDRNMALPLIVSEFIEEQWKANPHDACICSGIDQTSRSTKIQRKTVQECFSHWIYACGWSIIARSLQSVSWVFFCICHFSSWIKENAFSA